MHAIAREESKIPRITLCLLLSILNILKGKIKKWHAELRMQRINMFFCFRNACPNVRGQLIIDAACNH